MSFGPRLRVLYLATVAVGVVLLRAPVAIAALVVVQIALWPAVGQPARRLARQLAKLAGFAAFLIASYALSADDPATDRWIDVALPADLVLPLNLGGAITGALFALRVLAVVLASQVARAGDARAIARGLAGLGVPAVIAVPIDTVLALLGDEPRGKHGRGRGDGRGGGGLRQGLARLRQGDVGPLIERLHRQIARAERHVAAQDHGRRPPAWIRDVAVIAGVSLTMLGVKALKILPAIPFAPGHKLVVLTPLYVAASLLTRHRLGATLTGLTMGSVAFLLGDGKYGVFEILKHVAPGLLCDLCVPLLLAGERRPGRVAWTAVGGVIAAGRFATILAMVLLVQAPSVAYAIVVPGLAVHVGFGLLSGLISFHLWRALDRARVVVPGGAPTVGTTTKELP